MHGLLKKIIKIWVKKNLTAKCKHIPDELWRWQANIVTTIFVDGRQNEKCLELPDLARKLIRIFF